ncbi:Fucose 4-O-acetylase [Xylanibacter ruminicola]|uniref:Fucose 4-O-acetylase n=1 Tax=Xylanibacter ruminicola TaxID=839 RepID=A0A1H4C4I0_XYLRU|nr:acyltransferase family protein [Xylanibacter ruminicola]SEA55254.1 Fucose 4-O-acetylase [Xylanibacter ruminicola]
MKKRFVWVDYLKATLIFLMVLGHSSQQGIVGAVLSSFHMPAFFMVSGFLYHNREPKKLLKSFVFPFIIYYLLWLFKVQFINYQTEGHFISGYISETFCGLLTSDLSVNAKSSFPGYWFLIVLLLIRLYAGDLKIFRNFSLYRLQLSLTVIILYGVLLALFPNQTQFISRIYLIKAIVCFPFFYLGIYVREMSVEKRERLFSLSQIWLVLLFASSLILSSINGPVNVMLSEYGKNFVLFIINTLPMTLFLINIFMRFTSPNSKYDINASTIKTMRNKITSVVTVISDGTLLILGIHGIIIGFFKMAFQNTSFFSNPFRPLCCACIVMIICYPLIILAKKRMPILLGK